MNADSSEWCLLGRRHMFRAKTDCSSGHFSELTLLESQSDSRNGADIAIPTILSYNEVWKSLGKRKQYRSEVQKVMDRDICKTPLNTSSQDMEQAIITPDSAIPASGNVAHNGAVQSPESTLHISTLYFLAEMSRYENRT